MKLATFEITTVLGKSERIAAVIEDKIVDSTLGSSLYMAAVESDPKACQIAEVRKK